MRKTFLFIAMALILVSCKSYKPPQNYTFDKERNIDKSYDKTWERIIQFFGEANTPIKNMDKSSGFISTEFNLGTTDVSGFFDCGEPAASFGSQYKFENPLANFNIVVQRISDTKTKVKINTFFKCEYVTYVVSNSQWQQYSRQLINCNSMGKLELALLNYISQNN